jgi:transcriptional regulator with XRE-family HTH domain
MPRSRKSRYAPDYQTLLELLVTAREKANVTQVTLAARMETSQSMLSKLERGVVRMDMTDLLGYLDGIGMDPVRFMKRYLQHIHRSRTN